MRVVKDGGLQFLTNDVFLIAAVRRCAQLEEELREAKLQETARFRTLRRDVDQIKRGLAAMRRHNSHG